MKRANRPVPIAVPQQSQGDTAAASFNLTDSGVWSEGGLVFSTTGCIIDKGKAATASTAAAVGSDRQQLAADGAQEDSITLPYQPTSSAHAVRAEQQDASSSLRPHAGDSAQQASSSGSPASSSIMLPDLQELAVIGSGSSGVVKKVLHRPTQQVYVLKVINLDMNNQQVRRQVTREVRALDGARHPHVVSYHQSFFAEGAVTILMEFMDGGTLWDLLQKIRVVPEPYLAELTRQMLLGLSFLHDTARICHRDVKPSNLLLSSSGQLKISDFGTSSQLSNSMSKCLSWVGTVTYMSPERIKGDSYSFNTDVWSLGLLVLECALGRYPYPPQQQGAGADGSGGGAGPVLAVPPKLGFWELLEYIVVEPAPRLPSNQFSPELVDFIGQCLQKDAARRPSASQLLLHPFVANAGSSKVSLADLLKLPAARQQQHSSGGGGGIRGSSSGGVRRSGSYGGIRGGPLRASSGGFGGVRSSWGGAGLGGLGSAGMQHSSIMGRPPVAAAAAAAAGAASTAAALTAAAVPSSMSRAGTEAAKAAGSTCAAGGAVSAQGSSRPSNFAAAATGAGSAAAGVGGTAGTASAAAGAAIAGAPAVLATPVVAAVDAVGPTARSPVSPQPAVTTSPPAPKDAAASRVAGAAAAAAGGGNVTPAMAAAAAAALRESSPLLSGQLLRQSVMRGRGAGTAAAAAAGGGGGVVSHQQQEQQQHLRQPMHVRQSMQPQQQQQAGSRLQQQCGPLQQQQHWLSNLAAQQHAQTHAPQQQQQQPQQQQHPQGPLAQQLAGIQLQHKLQQLQRGSTSSPREPGSQAATTAAAAAAQAGRASPSPGEVAVHVGRLTPEKQRAAPTGPAQGSPRVNQGPLTTLRPPSSRRVHD